MIAGTSASSGLRVLFTAAELLLKTVYMILWLVLSLSAFDRFALVPERPCVFFLVQLSLRYITVSIPLTLYPVFLFFFNL
jgi:alpha-1,3-glucosyltransferase